MSEKIEVGNVANSLISAHLNSGQSKDMSKILLSNKFLYYFDEIWLSIFYYKSLACNEFERVSAL